MPTCTLGDVRFSFLREPAITDYAAVEGESCLFVLDGVPVLSEAVRLSKFKLPYVGASVEAHTCECRTVAQTTLFRP